jgi:hypothetical protein
MSAAAAPTDHPAKAHTAAVCIAPPYACWAPIQDARCFSDKSFVRWMPHINLLYPFLSDEGDAFERAAAAAARALSGLQPFQVRGRGQGHQ